MFLISMKTVANIIETLSAMLDVRVEEPGAEVGAELPTPHHVWPASPPPSIAPGQHQAW